MASDAEALRIIHHCGHIPDCLYRDGPPSNILRLIARSKEQFLVNLQLLDLTSESPAPDTVAIELLPDVNGFGDAQTATKMGGQFKIDHLTDDSMTPLLECGLRSLECLTSAGVLK